ncbi:transmembrane protein 104-like isoform X2 [Apostichopus japonicus]|uniref:transmembrane protein 104-like isoform X2 n=1 Tax=Stichopus japonicus TaxID=307972 RepID=UPI003AB3580F
MAGPVTDSGDGYSPWVGLIYIFNLIVGTGALTMPLAFSQAGWLTSIVIICLLAFAGFVNATFVIEAMAAANAIIKHKRKMEETDSTTSEASQDNIVDATENTSLLHSTSINNPVSGVPPIPKTSDYFEITETVEMGKLASLFFNKIGVNFFYIVVAIYLYGDLAIYAVVIPKSLTNITCKYAGSGDDLCWKHLQITHNDAYRCYLTVFVILVGPFVFFNMQKTKYLQVATSILRWMSFTLMILLACVVIFEGKGSGKPEMVGQFKYIPSFFGVCVYSFMCHHSLPSLITPVQPKSHLTTLVLSDYLIILSFYMALCLTAIFCFSEDALLSVYTLNFFTSTNPVLNHVVIKYFLALFPVFTLSTSFPIIGITLRNNLRTLLSRENRPCPTALDRFGFPCLTLIPPITLAYITQDVKELVGYTGSYAGVCIQYVIPACLVYYCRKETKNYFGTRCTNRHASPFRNVFWVILVQLWAFTCLVFVSSDHILEALGKG